MDINVLFTAHATSVGGRDGHVRSDDGALSLDLSVPVAMGGAGRAGATTPEHLFAAGYAACFGSACELGARRSNVHPTSIEVDASVGLARRADGAYTLVIELDVAIGGLTQSEAERVVAIAHEVCPYSNVTRGNVDVAIRVRAGGN